MPDLQNLPSVPDVNPARFAPVFIAEYDGVSPTAWTDESNAMKWCDDLLRDEHPNAGSWDWVPDEGAWKQVWVDSDTDRPLALTGAYVTRVVVDGEMEAPVDDKQKRLMDDLVALAAAGGGGADAAVKARSLVQQLCAETLREGAREIYKMTSADTPPGQSERYWTGWNDCVDSGTDKLHSLAFSKEHPGG